MADKLIVRVLAAVEAGHSTVTAVAMATHANASNVSDLLAMLARDGLIWREQYRTHQRGRPHYEYRIIRPDLRHPPVL
jgi:predicted transcriptional regulator